MSDTVRAFIAAPLDAGVRDRAASLCSRLAESGAAVKWVERENFHITLVFLGDVTPSTVDQAGPILRDAAGSVEAFGLTFRGVGAFPNLKRPKILWVGVEDGAEPLRVIHARLSEKLGALDSVELESREYTPHLTLGRVRSDRNLRNLTDELRDSAGWHAGPTRVSEIALMKSELTATGPVYSVIETAPLRQT